MALSAVLPGMGQIYNGQRGRAVAFCVSAPLLLPWFAGIYEAWHTAREIQAGRCPGPDRVGRATAFAIHLGLVLATLGGSALLLIDLAERLR